MYESHIGELLQPPRKERVAQFPELIRHEFKMKDEKMDIVFSGLGWITVNERGVQVAAYVPKGVSFVKKAINLSVD